MLVKILFIAVFLLVSDYPLIGQTIKPTPNEDDIPKPVPEEISLAGAERPDIARFLNVRSSVYYYPERNPSLSPGGKQLAFNTRITGIPQLWVVDVRGRWPQQLTFGESVTFHQWSPTGEWIIYGTDRGGNEREGYYLITPDGKIERELLPASEAFRVFDGFSRDGKKITYATTERNGRDFDIHLLDVKSGYDQELFRGRMGLYAVSWQPDGGAVILSEARGEDANDIYLFDITSGKTENLFRPEIASSYSSFSWMPDGSGFYLVTNQDRDFSALAYYNLNTGRLTYKETPDGDVEQVALSDDGQLLGWTINNGGYSLLHIRDLSTKKKIQVPELPQGIYSIHWAKKAPVLAISIIGPQIPGDTWTWNVRNGDFYRSTYSTAAGLDLSAMVIPTHYSFKARDGVALHGLLYMPPGLEPGVKPVVLLAVHGGPTFQARPRFDPVHQYLLRQGIAIFDLNFRGSTGYGKNFARLNDRRLRENEIYDLADALDWLSQQGKVDATRASIMGLSYGGYLTMAALTRLPESFKSGVAFVGVSNWITALEGASPSLKASDRIEYGDIDDPTDREFFRRISPITYVTNVVAPVMVLHGANDTRVLVKESDQFVRAIREKGGEVEYLRFPDEGHEIRKLSNKIIAYRRIATFLKRTLMHQGDTTNKD